MRIPQITTEGDKIFNDAIADDKSPFEAAILAYPEQVNPVEYMLTKPQCKIHMKEWFHYCLYNEGATISRIAKEKMKALKMAYEDPKGAKTADTIVQDFQQLWELYPEKKESSSLTVNNFKVSTKVEIQQQVLNQLYEDASKHSSSEQIDLMVENDIIEDVGVLPPEQLFEVSSDEEKE